MHQENKINLSIIIPVFNEEKYLNKLFIDLKQYFNEVDIEVIVINDGSDDDSLEISSIQSGHYGVIKFSGRSKEKNFNKHSKILRKELEKNDIKIIGPSIKATYNGPFTLPRFRRNESMFLVSWDRK